jgi:hypothetical protein
MIYRNIIKTYTFVMKKIFFIITFTVILTNIVIAQNKNNQVNIQSFIKSLDLIQKTKISEDSYKKKLICTLIINLAQFFILITFLATLWLNITRFLSLKKLFKVKLKSQLIKFILDKKMKSISIWKLGSNQKVFSH